MSSGPEALVDGEWGEFTFRMLTPEDAPGVIKNLREHFIVDEPLCSLVGMANFPPEALKEFDDFAAKVLEDNLSFAAIHTASGRIAGVRVTGRATKPDAAEQSQEGQKEKLGTPECQMVFGFLLSAEKQVDLFQKYGVDEYANLYFASVDRDFRGKGLATEMYVRVIRFLRAKGYKVTKSSFTSPYTRKISEKFGFQELVRKSFTEIETAQGDFPYTHAGDSFVSVKALVL